MKLFKTILISLSIIIFVKNNTIIYNNYSGGIFYGRIIINREILPEPIISYIHSPKIKIFEENDNIILSPVKEKPNLDELFGMFSDGKLSAEEFIRQKAIEKEMKN
jgi:hypothetical protein